MPKLISADELRALRSEDEVMKQTLYELGFIRDQLTNVAKAGITNVSVKLMMNSVEAVSKAFPGCSITEIDSLGGGETIVNISWKEVALRRISELTTPSQNEKWLHASENK